MKRQAIVATILILVHLVFAAVHGEAHESLGVGLAAWQWAFVYTVITAAPLVAMVLYWTPWRAAGALLLGVSMLGSFAFGVYHHFIAVSPDHVSHLPEGDAQGMFVATAVLLAISEAATAAFGFWSFGRLRKTATINP
ncbi:MAG: hypothetical protein WD845_03210 [Pirellulales bacterium]